MDLSSLNENQRSAVEWTGGPLLVLAGPGSGKTRVLTVRIAKILEDSPGKPFRVLALTFTNKAADEMRERRTAMLSNTDRALLTTFHSFCADVLRQHGSHVGIRPDFTILNQKSDQVAILTEVVRRLALDMESPGKFAEQYRERVEECLDDFCKPEDIPGRYKDPQYGNNVRLLFQGYRAELATRNALDFPSSRPPTSLASAGRGKQLRVVYQHFASIWWTPTRDTRPRGLSAAEADNLFVADDDQSFYHSERRSGRLQRDLADFNMAVIQLPTNTVAGPP